jgi:hypothetical protein
MTIDPSASAGAGGCPLASDAVTSSIRRPERRQPETLQARSASCPLSEAARTTQGLPNRARPRMPAASSTPKMRSSMPNSSSGIKTTATTRVPTKIATHNARPSRSPSGGVYRAVSEAAPPTCTLRHRGIERPIQTRPTRHSAPAGVLILRSRILTKGSICMIGRPEEGVRLTVEALASLSGFEWWRCRRVMRLGVWLRG